MDRIIIEHEDGKIIKYEINDICRISHDIELIYYNNDKNIQVNIDGRSVMLKNVSSVYLVKISFRDKLLICEHSNSDSGYFAGFYNITNVLFKIFYNIFKEDFDYE